MAELVRFVREVGARDGPERAVGCLRKFYGWYLRGGLLAQAHARRAGARADARRGRAAPAGGAPGAAPLVEQSGRDIAALGDIEDDELLDLPISIYSAG